MTVGHHQHTATILAFPVRTNASGRGQGLGAGRPGASDGKAPRVAQSSFTDSWYHQAAIEESTQTRKP